MPIGEVVDLLMRGTKIQSSTININTISYYVIQHATYNCNNAYFFISLLYTLVDL